jgi:deoxyribodipyrimidine photo-lyase
MSKKDSTSIVWFRKDLRISDNSAIHEASKIGSIIPIYILDDCAESDFKLGGASKVWLHNSINKLNESINGKLNIYLGNAEEVISKLIDKYNITNVFCNKCYEPWNIEQELAVKSECEKKNCNLVSFNDNNLWDLDLITKDDGSYYKVFTAYKKKSYMHEARKTVKTECELKFIKDKKNKTEIKDLNLLPDKSWYKDMDYLSYVGENNAQNKLENFIKNSLKNYKKGRDFPQEKNTSMMSPHLHFGEISPSQILESINIFGKLNANEENINHFISEIIWREFSYYLLHHFKKLHTDNFNSKFNSFPWKKNETLLNAWKMGLTGYPIVDAGMRELWKTGYMHNRVRMITASFLIKNLNIHWHEGRDWFWDCLFDADLANNSASWQWVAGCGADAAPYFRIFNPITQGEKFDKDSEYTRKFVPELKNIPDKYLFKPWTAPENILKNSGIILGENYPKPIIDLMESRNKSLSNYKNLPPIKP